MKKTVAMIYRFVFILFCVWGISRKIGYNILWLSPQIFDFTLIIDILSLLCVLSVFILSIIRHPGRILMNIKSLLSVCAVFVFLDNYSLILSGITYNWILGILLPLMMIIDWIFFDKKGCFNFRDCLIWSFGSLLLILLISGLQNLLFGVDNIFSAIRLFDNSDILKLVLTALFAGLSMYLIDCLVSAFGKRNSKNAFSMVFRLLFILLELYAFKKLVGCELTGLIYSFQYYHYFSNFLSVVAIAVILIYNLIKFKNIARTSTPIPRIKGAFTLCITATLLSKIFFDNTDVYLLSFSEVIIYYIAPIMMILDWFLFDHKGYFRVFDPIFWSIIPIIYLTVLPLLIYGGLSESFKNIFIKYVAVIIIGYIYFVIDMIFSKMRE